MNGNQITKVKIKGFKSIKECELDFQMVNVLIGSNGAGKSNFISLFKMLQSMIDGQLQLYVSKHGGPNALLHYGSKVTENLEVDFFFGKNGYSFTLEPTNDGRMMFTGEWFYWTASNYKRISAGHFESQWTKGSGTGIDNYVKPILAKQKWRVYHFHDTSDTALAKQLHGINDNMELATDARNLAAFLYMLQNSYRESYSRIIKTIRLVAPYFDDFILRESPLSPGKIQLEWKSLGSDIPFTASQLSDGTLRFICLSVLLLQPAELSPDTILVDEPELGLHPYAITVLASLIHSISSTKQVILSTQSVELLNEFEPEQIIVVDRDRDQSVFKRLDKAELAEWLENDYTLGDLWKKNLLGGRPSK